jgi:hypothetical protein
MMCYRALVQCSAFCVVQLCYSRVATHIWQALRLLFHPLTVAAREGSAKLLCPTQFDS